MNASPQSDTPATPSEPKPQSGAGCTAPVALWRVAEAFMHILHALFGAPEDVAARHTLRFEAHQLMASWLRAGEAMMRRLLLVEAAAHAKPNTRSLLRETKLFGRKRALKPMSFTPEAPAQWRVRFRCMERGRPRPRVSDDGTLRARTPALHKRPSRFRSAWPLAERYEPLLRVFNDPQPYARRLARRLHATPHRLRELLRAPPEAAHRIDQFETLTIAAESQAAVFNTS